MKRKIVLLIVLLAFAMTTIACNNQQNALDHEDRQSQPTATGDISRADLLSSEFTTIPSNDFPHTKPIQTQEAKFESETDKSQIHANQLYDLDADLILTNIRDELYNHVQQQEFWDEPPTQEEAQEELWEQPTPPEQDTPVKEPDGEKQQPEAEPQPQPEEQTQQPDEEQQPADQTQRGIGQEEQQVIELTNNHRREAGLSDLQADTELSGVARRKSEDMHENNYFSHTSPTYGSPFDMIRDHGVSYSSAGENIAQGQQTPEQVVQGWMNSEGHRENIMNGNFTHIGVGYEPNGNHWTQMFISR
ncbi:CAP domain-containing protein [Salipaludibacillus sp. HK11]|uniref:CAP domain-containing protein n=1 Tax=Salipaludibacillus sp. HK11 TaxID=3394320 RepID=UPI0039FC3E43